MSNIIRIMGFFLFIRQKHDRFRRNEDIFRSIEPSTTRKKRNTCFLKMKLLLSSSRRIFRTTSSISSSRSFLENQSGDSEGFSHPDILVIGFSKKDDDDDDDDSQWNDARSLTSDISQISMDDL